MMNFDFKIPEKYLKIIDDSFKCLFIKKLFLIAPNSLEPEIFGEYDEVNDTYTEDEKVYYYPKPDDNLPICWFTELEATGYWNNIIKEVCTELHKEEFLKFYQGLPWYQSDLADDEISRILIRKLYIEDKTMKIPEEV